MICLSVVSESEWLSVHKLLWRCSGEEARGIWGREWGAGGGAAAAARGGGAAAARGGGGGGAAAAAGGGAATRGGEGGRAAAEEAEWGTAEGEANCTPEGGADQHLDHSCSSAEWYTCFNVLIRVCVGVDNIQTTTTKNYRFCGKKSSFILQNVIHIFQLHIFLDTF